MEREQPLDAEKGWRFRVFSFFAEKDWPVMLVQGLVGERFDCAGMRWLKGKAEALLHLRCIELNGDWQKFVNWFQRKNQGHLRKGERRRVLTDEPITIRKAA